MAAKLKDPLKALAAALEQEQITGVSKKHIQKEVQSLITKVDVLIKYDEIRNQTFLTDSLSEVNVRPYCVCCLYMLTCLVFFLRIAQGQYLFFSGQ